MLKPLKILYAAGLSPNDFSQYRLQALERLGHNVVAVNAYDYAPKNSLLNKVFFRMQTGPWVSRLNKEILDVAQREKPDVFWADKLLSLRPETLDTLRASKIVSVSYMIDNAFGLRNDPGWRLYMQDIPHFDLHVTQRDKNLEDYCAYGARDVFKIQTAFEPTLQFPPPEGWSDKDRDRDVSFIGTPYDDRAEFLTQLWKEYGFAVAVSGGLVWKKALGREATEGIYRGHGELFRAAYREGIWKSKINLSFITHSNGDEFVHKSFEIAACQGFLLAERSAGHLAKFQEDEEAVFFSGIEECVEKIERYLPDEASRAKIAAAGRARALRDGYDNDTQVEKIVERVRELLRRIAA
jgi:spore maturation protein CgeB